MALGTTHFPPLFLQQLTKVHLLLLLIIVANTRTHRQCSCIDQWCETLLPLMQPGTPRCKLRAKPSKTGQAWGSTCMAGLAPRLGPAPGQVLSPPSFTGLGKSKQELQEEHLLWERF